MGFLDLALEDGELLAEQSILGNQVRFTECEIGGSVQEQGRASGLSEMTEGSIQKTEQLREEIGLKVEKERHAVQNSSRWVIETGEEIVTRPPICVKSQADEVFGKDSADKNWHFYQKRRATARLN
jgi:hypothetical protein